MATGVFDTSRSRHFRRSRKSRGSGHDAIDRFADALSQDSEGSVVRAASAIGVTPAHGYTLLRRIKQGLGSQAK